MINNTTAATINTFKLIILLNNLNPRNTTICGSKESIMKFEDLLKTAIKGKQDMVLTTKYSDYFVPLILIILMFIGISAAIGLLLGLCIACCNICIVKFSYE